MHNVLKNSLIKIDKERYLSLLMILAPLLNFLSGITFDLHAPSLPAIATYFSTSVSAAKSTITLTLLGFSVGCLFFGSLLDVFGRRPVVLIGLVLYTISSFCAPFCHTIDGLLLIRFIQGLSVSCVSIGCRTIIMDSFTGHQFKVAILYTSFTFGIGPIIAPFIGGYLQDHFGWQASFIAYGIISFILLTIFFLFIEETKTVTVKFSFKTTRLNYWSIIKHESFVPGIIIVGLSQFQQLIYTTIGAFLVENVLHYSAVIYGKTALLVSCGYLSGTIANRILLKHYRVDSLISLGFFLLITGIVIQVVCGIFNLLNLATVVLPMILIGFSHGFIFINSFTCCLRTSSTPGAVVSLVTASLMTIGTLGIYVISLLDVNSLDILAAIFAIVASIQIVVFIRSFRHIARVV